MIDRVMVGKKFWFYFFFFFFPSLFFLLSLCFPVLRILFFSFCLLVSLLKLSLLVTGYVNRRSPSVFSIIFLHNF